jgi:hypothetical protein
MSRHSEATRAHVSFMVWQVGHWLDHVVHWLYALSDRLDSGTEEKQP